MNVSDRICIICGAAFHVKRRRAPTRTCSKKCQYKQAAKSNMERLEANRPERVKKLQKICMSCGAAFLLPYTTSSQRFCSLACKNAAEVSDETRAKRSASLKSFNEMNPEANSRRTLAAAEGFARWLAVPENREILSERSRRVMNQLLEDDTIRDANKKALKRLHEELRASTNYNEMFAIVQKRLRMEFPYDGPGDWADYGDYIRILGEMTANDTDLQNIAVEFFKAELPRIMREEHKRRKETQAA